MSKLICVALLLVFLASIWCHNTVYSTKWSVRDVLRKCRCKVLPNGREICRKPLFPKTPEETKQLIKCFCRKYNLYKHSAKLNLEKCSFIWSNPF